MPKSKKHEYTQSEDSIAFKQAREKAGLNQAEAALLLGINRPSVSNNERGKVKKIKKADLILLKEYSLLPEDTKKRFLQEKYVDPDNS